MYTADDPITWKPQRIAVAGVTGSGKTTLCKHLAELLGIRHVEMDSLHHGPGWTRRETFLADVREFIAGPRWVTELQYREARPMIVQRTDTILWLDYATPVHMTRLLRRTVRRRVRREELWNGNYEPPLRTFLTDSDHILRWGWRTRKKFKQVIPTFSERFPEVHVVRFGHPRQTERWMKALAESS